MADDINLPNLLSHLSVNLDGLNGTVADAGRQGSSIGAALGSGVQRQLRDLVSNLPDIEITGDSDEVDRDLARVRRELEELGNQRIGVDISVDEALRRINELNPHLARLSDTHPNISVQAATRQAAAQLDELLAAARGVDDTDVDIDVDVDEDRVRRADRLAGAFGRIGGMASSLGGVAATIGRMAAGLGAAVPAAAAVVSTLQNVAPAAAVAVTGMAAVQLASGTVKLAMIGVKDAVSAALDPSKAKEYAESLKKLSPAAREFAEKVHSMAPALRAVQQEVQQEVFSGLATNLEHTSKAVLPPLRKNLLNSATALGDMAGGALGAARDLGENGTLGVALGSASAGLRNLSGVPGVVVTALGQLAAAAGPSFKGLTAAAARSAADIGRRLGTAFQSGALRESIQHAIDLLGDMVDVGRNVATIIGNIFNAAPEGGGLISFLGSVTTSLADATATDGVQNALRSLFQTMTLIGQTAGPLLAQALSVIGPVVTALAPPVQEVVAALGTGLRPIIAALGPVLAGASGALGVLVSALAPLLPVLGQLVAGLLPAFTPLLAAFQTGFQALAPVIQQVATILQATLAPILAELPALITPLAQLIADRLVFLFDLLGQMLVQLSPVLVSLGQTLGTLLVALTPLLGAFVLLQSELFTALMPVLTQLITLVGGVARVLAAVLGGVIKGVVVPIIQALSALLRGDFSGAWNIVKAAVSQAASVIGQAATRVGAAVGRAVNTAVDWIKGLPGRAVSALAPLAANLGASALAAGARLVTAISSKIADAVGKVRALPGQAASALGNLGGRLMGAGASLIQGFIDGIQSKIGAVKSKLGEITNSLTDWKGPPAKDARILTPAGRLLIEGFIRGIDESTSRLRSRLASITRALPDNVRSGIGRTLARATAELQREVTRRDGVVKRLAAAQKRLDDLVKARSKASADIRSGILSEANITTGHSDVNSVGAITVELQQALKASKAFQANIAKLKKAGLRSDLLQQIADAGVAGGSATADALAKATPAELKKINDLQSQLSKSATATGNTVGDALYGAGIRAAQGLVAGLKSQEKAIEAQMLKIARQMLAAIKKVHKIKSPSRAFHALGVMDGEGLRGGLLATAGRVRAAARTVAGAALDVTAGALATTPTARQLSAVYAGGAGGGDQNNVFNLYSTEATPDGILRALSWQSLVGGQ
ncbi:hypothetical protein [Streptomyces sp. NPDC050504]|uniref:hypothetical protein n=1 Tax=Streptomyces sp. NPDC050504 TaxID=3365618 RepID=UPI0037886A89